MPVYLVHGFRWPREGHTGIRVHAVVNNLDNCSTEYIQNENSRTELLSSFHKAFPEIMKELDGPTGRKLEFIEQYDPEDTEGPYAVSQPYAFVGDKVVMMAAGTGAGASGVAQAISPPPPSSPSAGVPATPQSPESPKTPQKKSRDATALSINMEDVIADGPGLTNKAWEALADLRDKIAEGEKIGWWVVYNGDPERSYDEDEDDELVDAEMEALPEEAESEEADPQRRAMNPTQSPPMAAQSATQQRGGLTALPTRQAQPSTPAAGGPVDKGKQKEVPPEPAKLKEVAKSQGLRRKFFGKRS